MPFDVSPAVNLKEAVKTSLWVHEPAVLYWATVQQFKAKPSKKRCIAIHDTFIAPSGPWGGSLAESAEGEVKQAGVRRQMQAMVDWMRELRQTASSMNFFSRIKSSSSREVAHANFFDVYNDLIKLEIGNGPLTNFLKSPQKRSPLSNWKVPADKAKAALEGAGFDTKALGLKEI